MLCFDIGALQKRGIEHRCLSEAISSNFEQALCKTHKRKSCRSRQELSNEYQYFISKFGFETGENEPLSLPTISQKLEKIRNNIAINSVRVAPIRSIVASLGVAILRTRIVREVTALPIVEAYVFSNFYSNVCLTFWQILRGSFSAGWMYRSQMLQVNSKYSSESSRRDLHNALLRTVLVGSVWVL